MTLHFIRHGDPDYAHDCLTEKGRRQAELLADRLMKIPAAGYYTSPMGRAKETAQFTLDRVGKSVVVCDWLHEYDVHVRVSSHGSKGEVWDMHPLFRSETPIEEHMDGEPTERYIAAAKGLDGILAEHGLVREDCVYRVEHKCDDTLIFFCHFGITCVMIGHLMGISPIIMCNALSADPTAIATLCTDDRFGGYTEFRLHGFGDTTHLGQSAIHSQLYAK